jgi:hypothetical protein
MVEQELDTARSAAVSPGAVAAIEPSKAGTTVDESPAGEDWRESLPHDREATIAAAQATNCNRYIG